VTNAEHDAVLEISAGTVTLNAGQLTVDRLVMTDPCASFVHNGGTLVYGTAVLDPVRDDDGDGIPNGYEQGHGLDPLNATDADLDNDGDGMSNLQEYLAGTDPNDASSAFRITGIAREGADMRITWTTGSGRTNALQVATDSVTGTFSDAFIVTDTVAAVTNYLDVGATLQSRRFYRVWLVP
jgi:hypothetical protein